MFGLCFPLKISHEKQAVSPPKESQQPEPQFISLYKQTVEGLRREVSRPRLLKAAKRQAHRARAATHTLKIGPVKDLMGSRDALIPMLVWADTRLK